MIGSITVIILILGCVEILKIVTQSNFLNPLQQDTESILASFYQHMCLGLYCDYNETITSNFQCEMSEENFKVPHYSDATYVYFKPNPERLHHKTASEKYVESLKSNLKNLKMKKIHDKIDFIKKITNYYLMVIWSAGMMKFFQTEACTFIK